MYNLKPVRLVIEVSDLRATLEVLEVIGCKTLRHYQVDQGSKTVVGWAGEDQSFTFELHHDVCFTSLTNKDTHGIMLYYKNHLGDNIQ
jgi:hypothetical protein